MQEYDQHLVADVQKYTFQYLKISLCKESCYRGVGSVAYASRSSLPSVTAVQSKNSYPYDLVSYNLLFDAAVC